MNRIKFCLVLFLQTALLFSQKDFSFVYLPDIHLQPDPAVVAGFENVAVQVNNLNPDFVLTGGDMIYTAKNVNDRKAAVLFDLMDKEFRLFKMPVHLTIGNHEHVGITGESGIDKTNPYWGKKMYEKRYGSRYYTFIYDGWKFFVLDGIKILEKEKDYTQGIDAAQIRWIKSELAGTGREMPLVISIHTPVINPHAITSSEYRAITPEIEAVMDLFKNHNLKLVLEGHTHLYMYLFFHGIYYISGGSTAYGTDEMDDGFVRVTVKNNELGIRFNKISGRSSKN